MNDERMPIYSNTCGKLFADRVVFASILRETAFLKGEIKNISLQRSIRPASLFFMALPCLLFIMPFFLEDHEHGMRVILFIIGTVLFFISVYNAERTYSLKLFLTNGQVVIWYIWKGNISDARKFVRNVKASLKNKV